MIRTIGVFEMRSGAATSLSVRSSDYLSKNQLGRSGRRRVFLPASASWKTDRTGRRGSLLKLWAEAQRSPAIHDQKS